jgi:hypothetical protein
MRSLIGWNTRNPQTKTAPERLDQPRDGFCKTLPSPQRKYRVTRSNKRPQGEVKLPPRKSPKTNFANCTPSASLFDGRTLLGFLFDHDDRCAALTADHVMIGDYADRTAARHAITVQHASSVP